MGELFLAAAGEYETNDVFYSYEMSARGVRQARSILSWMRQYCDVREGYVSPWQTCLQTAAPLRANGIRFTIRREIGPEFVQAWSPPVHNGVYHEMDWSSVSFTPYKKDDYLPRVKKFAEEIANKRVVVVAHSKVLSDLIKHFCDDQVLLAAGQIAVIRDQECMTYVP